MRRTIKREYVLNLDEVKAAIFRHLKEIEDVPVPNDYSTAILTWNAPGEAFISWTDSIGDS